MFPLSAIPAFRTQRVRAIRVKVFVPFVAFCSKICVPWSVVPYSVVSCTVFRFQPPTWPVLKINAPQTPRVYWRKPQFDRLCCPATCNFQNLCQNCLVSRKTTRTSLRLPPQAAPGCAHRPGSGVEKIRDKTHSRNPRITFFAVLSFVGSCRLVVSQSGFRFQVSGDSASTGSPAHRSTGSPTPNPPIL
jgi:hypothetical protein